MTTTRERIFEALFTQLKTASGGMQIERNQPLPDQIPTAGLVVQRDGQEAPAPAETYLASPPVYLYEEIVEVECAVQLADDAGTGARESAIDAVIAAITTALIGARTLGGLADDLRIRLPKLSDLAVAGAAPIKSATMPVRVFYATSDAGT